MEVEKTVTESRLERAEAEAMKDWHAQYGEVEVKKEDAPVVVEEPKVETPVVEEPPKVEVKAEKVVDWEQKYRTLEGKYRAEVPRLSEEIRSLKESLTKRDETIAELRNKLNEIKKTETIVGDDDLNKLEADYPGVGKAVKKLIDGYETKIASLEQQVTTKVSTELDGIKADNAVTREQQFDQYMQSAGVEDWRTINTMPEFHEWLADVIPYTRQTKLEALRDAGRNFDAETAARIFLDFKATLKKEAPVVTAKAETQENLEQYIAPSTVTVGKQDRGSVQTGYTRADYTKFMQESAKGKFIPSKWGGKTEAEVEAMFDGLIANGSLN